MATFCPRVGPLGSVTVNAADVVLQKYPALVDAVNPVVCTVVFHTTVLGVDADVVKIAVPVSAGQVSVFDPATLGPCTVITPDVSPAIPNLAIMLCKFLSH